MTRKLFAIVALGAVTAGAQAVVLMDQITGLDIGTQSLFGSQEFGDFPTFHIAALDNFTTTADGFIVQNVQALMGNFNGTAGVAGINNVTAFRVEIYSSVAAAGTSLTGDAGTATIAAANAVITDTAFVNTHVVSLDVNFTLAANTEYWVAVMPVQNFGGGLGQWGIAGSNVGSPLGQNAWQANPAGGFGFGATQQISPANDLAYSVEAVPEPGTMAALGLGLLAALRRKRA